MPWLRYVKSDEGIINGINKLSGREGRVENTISFSPEREREIILVPYYVLLPAEQTYYLKSFGSPSETITRSLLSKFPPRNRAGR